MRKALVLIAVACGLLLTRGVSAQSGPGPIPLHLWTPAAQVWLARAVTAEAGWNHSRKVQREQILLAYILVERYNIRKRWYNPNETFVMTIRAYCNGMKSDRRSYTNRMRRMRSLAVPDTHRENGSLVIDYPIKKPKRWSKKLSWTRYQQYYGKTWIALDRWSQGLIKHPCPGAKHWGSRWEAKQGDMVPLACSRHFNNIIYGVK